MFHNRKHDDPRRGFTMAEVLISTTIVGVMLAAALESVGMVYRSRRISANRLTGPGLAQELMAEVLSMPYEDPQSPGGSIGPETGEAIRDMFDDIDDYNNWNSNDARGRDGTAFTGYSGWQQQVQVAYAGLADPSVNSGSDLGLKRITVTVTSPTGTTVSRVALRAQKGAVEQPQGLDANAVTWLGATLQVGAGTRNERWGTTLINPAADVN
jgi:prepilin-type N-terminal cleavage/methylation domain-containing protein